MNFCGIIISCLLSRAEESRLALQSIHSLDRLMTQTRTWHSQDWAVSSSCGRRRTTFFSLQQTLFAQEFHTQTLQSRLHFETHLRPKRVLHCNSSGTSGKEGDKKRTTPDDVHEYSYLNDSFTQIMMWFCSLFQENLCCRWCLLSSPTSSRQMVSLWATVLDSSISRTLNIKHGNCREEKRIDQALKELEE